MFNAGMVWDYNYYGRTVCAGMTITDIKVELVWDYERTFDCTLEYDRNDVYWKSP